MKSIEKGVKSYDHFHHFQVLITKYANSALLGIAFLRDMAWPILNSIGSICSQIFKSCVNIKELKPGGPQTTFLKNTPRKDTINFKLKYLPVIHFSSEDNIVKYYLNMSRDFTKVLGFDCISAHAFEAFTSKINMILLMHQSKYGTVIPSLAGFYTLVVYLKILHEKVWLVMVMMNCFCGMVDRRKAFSLIPGRDNCQRSSPLQHHKSPTCGEQGSNLRKA